MRRGFTLIELLIVVAIIAILAAIAVPNFLCAQMRAKVSRAASDLRTQRTAIEAYAVDWNQYPRSTWACEPFNDTYQGDWSTGTLFNGITSPIAYITSLPNDPFAEGQFDKPVEKLYQYTDLKTGYFLSQVSGFCGRGLEGTGLVFISGSPASLDLMSVEIGRWLLWSCGPTADLNDANGNVDDYTLIYDPTNGCYSNGRLFITEKHQDFRYVTPNLFQFGRP
jgi:prepilin-type N-terminal cleavage/methylation domain-containing protein